MQYRTMPNSDEKLSVLGFGCMRLPVPKGRKQSILRQLTMKEPQRKSDTQSIRG